MISLKYYSYTIEQTGFFSKGMEYELYRLRLYELRFVIEI